MKALVVGLGAFTPELTFPWAQEGTLPALGRLLEEGVWGRLESVPNMNSASAWNSFATGLEPGRHGVFHFTEIVPGTYYERNLNASHRRGKPFWGRLSDLGHRVGVINVPMTYPAEPVAGFMVAGRGAPSPQSQGFSYPAGFFDGIANKMQRAYCIEAEAHRLAAQAQWDEAARVILDSLEARREFVLRASDAEVPDLLMVVFTAADVAQHLFWRYLNPQAFGLEVSESEELGSVVQRVYRRLDDVLAELVERTAPEAVVVLSERGAGFNQRGGDYLFAWLQSMGLLHTQDKSRGIRRWLARARAGDDRCPPGTRPIQMLAPVDWSRTQAYCVGTDDIHINLRGREPQGIVSESQYESLCQKIIERLLETVDPVTKMPVVEIAAMSREVYEGPFAHRSPDIMIRWRTEQVLNGLETPGCAPVLAQDIPLITGSHRPQGVFLAAGMGIRKAAEIRGARITDVAPTLLHFFGDGVPISMDGRVLVEIFEPEWMAMHPVIVEERATGGAEEGTAMLDDDVTLVEERLRGLGYID